MINVFSVLDMEESFQQFVSKYYMIGGFLVVILAFIGIMNFFNTTATSVISRKKELALLEVVGMTKKQVSKMLVTEAALHKACLTALYAIAQALCGVVLTFQSFFPERSPGQSGGSAFCNREPLRRWYN